MQWLLPLLVLPLSTSGPLIIFTSNDQSFAEASGEYRQLWCTEGRRIMASMEQVTGFANPAGAVEVFVADVTPMTAFGGRPMWLKASYPIYYKQANLFTSLVIASLSQSRALRILDEHRLLYLFMHDVWSELYGANFPTRWSR